MTEYQIKYDPYRFNSFKEGESELITSYGSFPRQSALEMFLAMVFVSFNPDASYSIISPLKRSITNLHDGYTFHPPTVLSNNELKPTQIEIDIVNSSRFEEMIDQIFYKTDSRLNLFCSKYGPNHPGQLSSVLSQLENLLCSDIYPPEQSNLPKIDVKLFDTKRLIGIMSDRQAELRGGLHKQRKYYCHSFVKTEAIEIFEFNKYETFIRFESLHLNGRFINLQTKKWLKGDTEFICLCLAVVQKNYIFKPILNKGIRNNNRLHNVIAYYEKRYNYKLGPNLRKPSQYEKRFGKYAPQSKKAEFREPYSYLVSYV
ncbi:MAG: hypothetical protein JJ975_01480 [Bacteroidia bacterium]|nr:hypothetical protein [Bacteroidia bacterium]